VSRFDLRGRHVLITGASGGLGAALAEACAARGARLSLVARSAEALERVARSCQAAAAAVETVPYALPDLEGISRLSERCATALGGIDVLVNNAALAVAGGFEEVPLSTFRRAFDLNVLAPVALTAAVIPGMKARRSGQIVNVTSGLGWRGVPGLAPYGASKFALNGLTESLRGELRAWGIHVLLVSPGSMATGFDSSMQRVGRAHVRTSRSRPAPPERVAQRIVGAMERRQRELVVRNAGWLLACLNQVAPRLVDRVVERAFGLV
jgi:short-subunit dehydrogenase